MVAKVIESGEAAANEKAIAGSAMAAPKKSRPRNAARPLDEIECALLSMWQDNCRLSDDKLEKGLAKLNLELARGVRKLGQLKRDGFIAKEGATLNYEKFGLKLSLMLLNVKSLGEVGIEQLAKKLTSFKEVQEVYEVAGTFDYVVKVRAPEGRAVEISRAIRRWATAQTLIVNKTCKETTSISLTPGKKRKKRSSVSRPRH